MKYCLLFFLSFACFSVFAEPEYYSILADCSEIPDTQLPPPEPQGTLWRPTAEDIARGFAVHPVDVENTPHPDWIWPENVPEKDIAPVLIQRGEFQARMLMVRSLKNITDFTVTVSSLVSGQTQILAENLDLRIVRYRVLNANPAQKGQIEGNLLDKLTSRPLEADRSWFLWLTIHAPMGAAAGIYQGKITFSADGKRVVLPLQVRVLDRDFQPASGDWGFWIPGHLYNRKHGYGLKSQGNWVTPAPAWWTDRNLASYFRFWHTRNFTSPCFAVTYPQLTLWNGKYYADFGEINWMIRTARAAGLNGRILYDGRFFCFWSHMCADIMTRKFSGKLPKKGGVGVTIYDGRHYFNKGLPYGELAKTVFLGIASKIRENAEKNPEWGNYLVYTDEEIDNHQWRTQGFEFFNPLMRQAVGGDHVVVIDNSVGFSRNLDRGHRDGLRFRSYNNWTIPALKNAEKDNAVIMSFNIGRTRSAWGWYQAKIGSVGHHLWADNWSTYLEYYNTAMNSKGKITTSVTMERAALGLRDLAVCRELEAEGKSETVKELAAPVELEHYLRRTGRNQLSGREQDARRYQALLALGVSTGQVSEALRPALIAVEKTVQEAVDPRTVEIHAPEGKFGSLSSKFAWTRKEGRRQRSMAVSEEDYKLNRQPSEARCRVKYDNSGLSFQFRAVAPDFSKLSRRRSSGDPELWKDDVFEIFLQVDKKSPVWQLVVNSAGKSLLLRDSTPVVSDGIICHAYPGKSGYIQEIFIPWKVIGILRMPHPGEAWNMNLAREYHARKEYVTWAGVEEKFGLANGKLFFGDMDNGFMNLKTGSGFAGRNRIAGQLKQIGRTVRLISPSGASREISTDQSGKFELILNMEPGYWRIVNPHGKVTFEVISSRKEISVHMDEQLLISGDRFVADVVIGRGDAENGSILHGNLIAEDGQVIPLIPMTYQGTSSARIHIATRGVPAGKYRLQLYFSAAERGEISAGYVTVLPSFL